VAGAREGYRTARAELGDRLPPGSLDAVLDAYRTEGTRLVETARAVDLVGRALRGEVFTPQLAGTQDKGRSAGGKRGPDRNGAKQQADRPSETARGRQAASPGEAAPAKQAASPGEATPAKRDDSPGEAAPAKQAASSRKAASAKRDDSPGEATPAKRAPGSRKATPAKQR
jgi:hypothetical protein